MGATSSTINNSFDKTRRRMSSAIDENLNEDTENCKGKALSMYDLQRERSFEAIKATAVSINNLGTIERKEENGSILGQVEPEQIKERSPNRRLLITTKRIPTDKATTNKSTKNSKTNPSSSPKNGYITTSAAAKSAQLAAAVFAGSSSTTPNSPQPNSSPAGLAASSETSIETTNSKQGQKRRTLTWAWLRGHEVSLSSTSNGPEKRNVPNRMTLTRRRSLKAGNSLINRSVSQQQNEWPSPVHRPSNANKLHSSTSLVNALSRRASLGRPLLAQLGAQKSIRKSDAGLAVTLNPISASGREIIQLCFEQPHNDIGARICSRLLEKRPDFRNFVYSMGKERWLQLTTRLRQFLDNVVRRVDSVEAVEKLARRYGEEHVELKCYGFKPDFWVSLADAMTVECIILDQATHQPSDTIIAWSLLVSLMFSAVRDGYYQAMRAQRISQRHRNVQQRELSLRLEEDVDIENREHSLTGVEKSASANELQSPVKRNGSQTNTFKFAEQKTSLTTGVQQQNLKLGEKKHLRKAEFF